MSGESPACPASGQGYGSCAGGAQRWRFPLHHPFKLSGVQSAAADLLEHHDAVDLYICTFVSMYAHPSADAIMQLPTLVERTSYVDNPLNTLASGLWILFHTQVLRILFPHAFGLFHILEVRKLQEDFQDDSRPKSEVRKSESFFKDGCIHKWCTFNKPLVSSVKAMNLG